MPPSVSNFVMSNSHHHNSNGVTPVGMSATSSACLQQRDGTGYSCMSRPTYETLSLTGSYHGGRPSCSPTQPYQHMNGVGHQYSTNGSSSTGSFLIFFSFRK